MEKMKWVSIHHKLPHFNEDVLVTDGKYTYVATLSARRGIELKDSPTTMCESNKGWYTYNSPIDTKRITHWMYFHDVPKPDYPDDENSWSACDWCEQKTEYFIQRNERYYRGPFLYPPRYNLFTKSASIYTSYESNRLV